MRALVYDCQMPPEPAVDDRPSLADEHGVDRAQIREMLQLTPEQRLIRVQDFVEAVLAIRALNETPPLRSFGRDRGDDCRRVVPTIELPRAARDFTVGEEACHGLLPEY